MKSSVLTIDEDFTTKLGKWWDSLSDYQRGMLIFAHRLNTLRVTSRLKWKYLDYSAQCEIAIRLCVTFSITQEVKFPDPPRGYHEAANDIKQPQLPSLH